MLSEDHSKLLNLMQFNPSSRGIYKPLQINKLGYAIDFVEDLTLYTAPILWYNSYIELINR
jgi:hypothetical protein|tara:strand:+ start:189 stop:371 length:183 start_codon:yes stop_codon:yes gene_type:complete